jgi:hypothetical protein
MTTSENLLLLEVRNVREAERFAETLPFQCDLWGKFPGEDWVKIAHVSNAGTGGCHKFAHESWEVYQRFIAAVKHLQNGPLYMTEYLDWALMGFFSYCAGQIGHTLPQDAPLKNEFEVADQIVTALLDYRSLGLEKHWVWAKGDMDDYSRVGKTPNPDSDRAWINREFPGVTIINDLGFPALRLPSS